MSVADLRNVYRPLSTIGYLVAKGPKEDCCQKCLREQQDGIAEEYSDFCCCKHGEVFGIVTIATGEIRWVDAEAERRYNSMVNKLISEEGSNG